MERISKKIPSQPIICFFKINFHRKHSSISLIYSHKMNHLLHNNYDINYLASKYKATLCGYNDSRQQSLQPIHDHLSNGLVGDII